MSFITVSVFFFFNDTATTEIYTLSLHDALPICPSTGPCVSDRRSRAGPWGLPGSRSEEHTSELQSRPHLVCRLLLEKKKIMASAVHESNSAKSITIATGSAEARCMLRSAMCLDW